MTERFPDLEIYILKAEAASVEQWLRDTFNQVDSQKNTDSHNHWRVDGMDVFLNAGAEKNFASLWFKQNQTPWNNDLELGRAAFTALESEVRCSDSGWSESESEDADGGWVKINRNGEKPFSW